jgi:hypothetical protein
MSDSPIRLSLSATGLQRLETVDHEKDFAFIVGTERYSCPSFVAEFISPRIASLRSQDVTIDEFSIETEDPGHHFGNLLSIGFGREVSFPETELAFLWSVGAELWNSELFAKTLKDKEQEITEEELKARLKFLSGVDGRRACDIPALASHFYKFSVSDFDTTSASVLESILSDPGLVVRDEDSLFELVYRRASEDSAYFGLLALVRFEFLTEDCMMRAFDFISDSFDSFTLGIWSSLRTRLSLSAKSAPAIDRFKPLPPIDSKIISDIPAIFSISADETLRLLYRGSRDGFGAGDFHARCDGHPNTITLISSTNDCIFGGYTPVPWSSRNQWVADPSLKTFIFTIKNPHNLPARIFKLNKAEYAMYASATHGPVIGGTNVLSVCDGCAVSNRNCACLLSFTNETGIPNDEVLTGAKYFTVAEIEVFDVIGRN